MFLFSIFTILIIVCLSSSSSGDSGDSTTPGEGDWIIENETFVSNRTITMNGNISVTNNSSFSLENVTLFFNSTKEQSYGLYIDESNSKANVTIKNSTITACDQLYTYNITIKSAHNIIIENSDFSHYYQIEIQEAKIIAETSNFTNSSYIGLYLRSVGNNSWVKNNFFNNVYYGIAIQEVRSGYFVFVEDNILVNGNHCIDNYNSISSIPTIVIRNNTCNNFSVGLLCSILNDNVIIDNK